MIQTELIAGGIRRYSDRGMKIRQVETGILYDEAIDLVDATYTYEETDVPAEIETNVDEIIDILLGGNAK